VGSVDEQPDTQFRKCNKELGQLAMTFKAPDSALIVESSSGAVGRGGFQLPP
jgi:hypothetical protein